MHRRDPDQRRNRVTRSTVEGVEPRASSDRREHSSRAQRRDPFGERDYARGSYAQRYGFAGDPEVDAPGLHDAEPRIRHDPADEHGDATSAEHDRMSDDGAEASDRSWTADAQPPDPEDRGVARSLALEARFERRHTRFSLAEYEPPNYEHARPEVAHRNASGDASAPAADADSVSSLPRVRRIPSEPRAPASDDTLDERTESEPG
ncbi:MAG: hypothetical protein IT453_20675 [Planctomycetes bacterium]|nr:hypothetical protein [Planctomycetota bacterium]